jgi:hypothetical protein
MRRRGKYVPVPRYFSRRGMGDTTGIDPVTGDTVICPAGQTFDGITGGCYSPGGAADCYSSSFVGPLPPGASVCAPTAGAVPTAASVPGALVVGGSCFMPLFPFIGTVQGSTCTPVANVPSPWNMVATVMSVGAILYLFMRRR